MFYYFVKETNTIDIEKIENWCTDNLKDGKFVLGNTTIYIESEIDATAFKLRWL